MSIKICFFSAQYLPTVGGVERYTYNLSKKLIDKGAEITIVTSCLNSMPEYENNNGIEIYRAPCFSLLNGRFPVVKNNKKFKLLISKLRSKNFDVIIINTRFYTLSVEGAKFAKKNDILCLLIEHGTSHLTVNNFLFDKLGEVFEHSITKKIKRYCNNFYGVSEACNEWLLHFGINANGVIYNAIDLEEINKLLKISCDDYRKKYGIPSNSIIISFAGRLVKEKGIENLIKAVKKINENGENLYLLAAGDGPLLNGLRKYETNNIKLLGKLSYEQVISLFKVSDIFCLPSKSEGFPTSVLEAVACKNFIITTYKGGAKELISNEELGIIMNDNSIETIYESLRLAIRDDYYRKNAIELSYKELCNNFTWDNVAEKLIRYLESIK